MQIDPQILEKCKKQDRRAQLELYNTCYSLLLSICLRYEKNKEDAEALLNLGFLKIITNLEKYASHVPFEAWIRRIMMNAIIDEFRKNKKEKELMVSTDFEDQHYNRHVELNSAQLQFEAEELQLMIQKLPTVTQKVFNLHVLDGYSHKEVSEMLEMSTGTSKWHVNNARKLLKGMIEDHAEKEKQGSNKSE